MLLAWLHFVTMSDDNSNISDNAATATAPSTSTHKSHRHATVKRTVKYLAVCTNPRAVRECLRNAPDSVAKCICNAAYNVERGDVVPTPKQKALFGKHRKLIGKLTSHTGSLQAKRKVLQSQKGGFIIPELIGAAISALGNLLFPNLLPH
jgi:hypothetical protein